MRALLIAAAFAVTMVPAMAEVPSSAEISRVAEASRKTAEASIGTLRALVTENTAGRMGFETAGQVGDATLGAPFVEYMIGLDRLREYQTGKDVAGLLQPTGVVHFPVSAAGATRCSITLARVEGGWRAVSFGAPVMSRALAEARRRAEAEPDDAFALTVPALNLLFVAHRRDERLLLTAAITNGLAGIEEGSTAPIEEILSRLQPEAARHDGLPR